MGGSVAFGYEQDNGTVVYNLSTELLFEQIEEYMRKRESPNKYNYISKESISVDDFFTEKMYEHDDSIWRILYMLDGTIKCKRWGSPGEFIYKLN